MSQKQKRTGVNISELKKKLDTEKKIEQMAKPSESSILKKNSNVAVKQKVLTVVKKKIAGISSETLQREEVDGLRKPSTYLMFCDWVATPEGYRSPATQKKFAEINKVDEDTLTLWKQRPTFWSTVEKRIKTQWRDKSGQVMQALYATILRKGSAKEVTLFFQLMWGLNLRDVSPDSVPEENNFDPAQLAQMAEAMKNAGLSGVTEHHKKLAEVFNDLAITKEDDDIND